MLAEAGGVDGTDRP